MLIYGNQNTEVDETHPVNPPPYTKPRTEFELEVVNNKDVEGTVVRPSLIYGKSGGEIKGFSLIL